MRRESPSVLASPGRVPVGCIAISQVIYLSRLPSNPRLERPRVERLFETLQDRLVKEMRLAGIDSIKGANHFLEIRFLPEWEQRFTVVPRLSRNAHRPLGREHRLEEILSVRVARQVVDDHTVSWDGNRWGVPREEVCAGLRGAKVEIERRLDGSHWLRFRNRYYVCVTARSRCGAR
jgi:hypothetical protein